MRVATIAGVVLLGLAPVVRAQPLQPNPFASDQAEIDARASAELKAHQPEVSAAEAAVREQLIDPDSAEFRKETYFVNGSVCGQVNAKNQMGGYTGYTWFVYGHPYVGVSNFAAMIPGSVPQDQYDAAFTRNCTDYVPR
jgi:hypothetical protein